MPATIYSVLDLTCEGEHHARDPRQLCDESFVEATHREAYAVARRRGWLVSRKKGEPTLCPDCRKRL